MTDRHICGCTGVDLNNLTPHSYCLRLHCKNKGEQEVAAVAMPAGSAAVVARKKQQNRAKKLAAKAASKEQAIDDWFKAYDKR